MNEFDDLADLEDVFGPLRSAARPAELLQEGATVDLMVRAHRTSEGKHMFTSRRARIATLVAAGVLGFGGMTAASSPSLGGGKPFVENRVVVQQDEPADMDEDEKVDDLADLDEVKVDEVKVEEKIEDVTVAETEIIEVDAEVVPTEDPNLDSDPDLDTAFDERYCETGNHGKTVSAVTRGEFNFDQYEADNPGVILTVEITAHSSCGKNGEVDPDEDETEEEIEKVEAEEDSEVEESERSEAKAERPGRSDKGADRASNGNGNSNGNGKRGG